MNMMGQTVYSLKEHRFVGEHQIELDVNHFASGVYQYFIEFNGQRMTRKMVIQR
jgi:hypothetical protein